LLRHLLLLVQDAAPEGTSAVHSIKILSACGIFSLNAIPCLLYSFIAFNNIFEVLYHNSKSVSIHYLTFVNFI